MRTKTFSYDGRFFRPIENSPNGEVCGETRFCYHQSGTVFSAEYSGGTIVRGTMIGTVQDDNSLHFVYQHLSEDGTLKAGICTSIPHTAPDGKLELHESWQWLTGDCTCGTSIVREEDA